MQINATQLFCDFVAQLDFNETETFTIGELKFGLCHGHQVVPWGDQESLKVLQRQVEPT
jgi:vacuolar protein sorting-associated protein 29